MHQTAKRSKNFLFIKLSHQRRRGQGRMSEANATYAKWAYSTRMDDGAVLKLFMRAPPIACPGYLRVGLGIWGH